MTRQGNRRKVDAAFSAGRLRSARDFHRAARAWMESAQEGENAAPAMSHIVSAAIAYGDAVSARFGGVVNSQDHAGAALLLRDVLREGFPEEQATRLRRMLGEKDSAQYGPRPVSLIAARQRMQDLDRFATWAEDLLADG